MHRKLAVATLRAAPSAIAGFGHPLTAARVDRTVAAEPRKAARRTRTAPSGCDLLLRLLRRTFTVSLPRPVLRRRALRSDEQRCDRDNDSAGDVHRLSSKLVVKTSIRGAARECDTVRPPRGLSADSATWLRRCLRRCSARIIRLNLHVCSSFRSAASKFGQIEGAYVGTRVADGLCPSPRSAHGRALQ